MVIVIDRSVTALQAADRSCGATLELVIIVAVQKVVFAVVLILHDGFGLGQARLECGAIALPFDPRAISITAPFQIGLGQIGLVGPQPFINHRLQTSAICSGF